MLFCGSVEQIVGKLVQQRGARASTRCGWRPPRGSNEELSSAETLPRHPHHLHFNSKISAVRTFWLTHSLWPPAKPCVFSQAAAIRSRLMKQDLGSTSVGAVFSGRARSLPHCPSMAFKSGEYLGWVVSKSNPAVWIAAWASSVHKHCS
jgi:hypothetical protein